MATKTILMAVTSADGDRNHLHEAIDKRSLTASSLSKKESLSKDLLDHISNDKMFNSVRHRLDEQCTPEKIIGRAPQQLLKVHFSRSSCPSPPSFPSVMMTSLNLCVHNAT